MAFGAADRFPDPTTAKYVSSDLPPKEWTYPTVAPAATGQTDWLDVRGYENVTFEFIAAAGGTSATVALQGALAADGATKPLVADFLGINSTDELSATAASFVVDAATRKIVSLPLVHQAIGYVLVSVTPNTLGGTLTIRAIATTN